MNRKKKMNETLKKRAKKANAKLQTSNKPKYVSKAERARLEAESNNVSIQSDSNEASIELEGTE